MINYNDEKSNITYVNFWLHIFRDGICVFSFFYFCIFDQHSTHPTFKSSNQNLYIPKLAVHNFNMTFITLVIYSLNHPLLTILIVETTLPRIQECHLFMKQDPIPNFSISKEHFHDIGSKGLIKCLNYWPRDKPRYQVSSSTYKFPSKSWWFGQFSANLKFVMTPTSFCRNIFFRNEFSKILNIPKFVHYVVSTFCLCQTLFDLHRNPSIDTSRHSTLYTFKNKKRTKNTISLFVIGEPRIYHSLRQNYTPRWASNSISIFPCQGRVKTHQPRTSFAQRGMSTKLAGNEPPLFYRGNKIVRWVLALGIFSGIFATLFHAAINI